MWVSRKDALRYERGLVQVESGVAGGGRGKLGCLLDVFAALSHGR